MTWNDNIVDMVDARIAAVLRSTRSMATCTGDSDPTGVTVIFDGDTVTVPVKVAGGIRCYSDDRVMVEKYGADWIVVHTYSSVTRNCWAFNGVAAAGTTTSGTYVDMPGPIWIDYQKHYTTSRLFVSVAASMFATVAGTSVALGVDIDSGTTNADMQRFFFNTANEHTTISGFRIIGGANAGAPDYTVPPAGSYRATLKWARIAGTGTMTQNSGDWIAFMIEEVY